MRRPLGQLLTSSAAVAALSLTAASSTGLALLAPASASAAAIAQPGAAGAHDRPAVRRQPVLTPVPAAAGSTADGLLPALTRQGPAARQGVASSTVRCTTTDTGQVQAQLALTATAQVYKPVPWSAWVDGRLYQRGYVVPGQRTNVSVTVPVTIDAAHTAALVVGSTRPPTSTPVFVHCPTPAPTSPAPAPSSPAPTPTPTGPGRGNASSYSLSHNSNGTVTRWNPCDGAIHVRANLDLAPSGAVDDVLEALRQLGTATGLTFTYDGTTSYVPTSSNTANRPAPLVIAWADRGTGSGQTDLVQSGAIAEGGWNSSAVSTDGGRTWNWKISSGFVVVDPSASSALTSGFGTGATRGALLLHELGHAVGLQHVSDQGQLMYPTLTSTTVGSYGAGDLAGLAKVGASNGCTTAS
jgi:hypothetical protein